MPEWASRSSDLPAHPDPTRSPESVERSTGIRAGHWRPISQIATAQRGRCRVWSCRGSLRLGRSAAGFSSSGSASGMVSRSTTNIQPFGRLTDGAHSPPASIAARRIRTCNQGIQGPSRFHEAWTISSSSSQIPPRYIDQFCHEQWAALAKEEAGRSRRGLLLGLTPLVSEPSWPPEPGQARLRIALPIAPRPCEARRSWFRFPAIHPVRGRRLPSGATFSDESPALPLS